MITLECGIGRMARQRKTSLALDERTLKTFRRTAERLNLSVSALLRLLAAKLESEDIKL